MLRTFPIALIALFGVLLALGSSDVETAAIQLDETSEIETA